MYINLKIVGKILKIFFTTLLLAFCALFIGRILILTDKSVLNDIVANDINRAAYAEANGKLTLLTHKQYDEISKEGIFGAYGLVYMREAKQVQFTVRYNDSIGKYTDYTADTEFTYFLYNSVTEEYVRASQVVSGERFMYNYRRVVFDDVDLEDGADYYLYVSPSDSSDDAFDSLPIHHAERKFKEYKPSKAERVALAK